VRTLLFFILRVQEVSHAAQLFRCRLQGFNLLAQLGLFGLLLPEHLVDISHEYCLLKGTVRFDYYVVNKRRSLRVTGVITQESNGAYEKP